MLDQVWSELGIAGNPNKKLDLEQDAKVLGVQVRGGTRLQVLEPGLWDIVEAAIDVLSPTDPGT